MKISVVGSGYVGTTLAAVLAVSDFDVTAIDIDPQKVEQISQGKAPFYEAGLDELLTAAINSGRLKAALDYDSLAQSDVIFSCVGTPDNPDGSPDMRYVNQVAETVGKTAKKGSIFVQKSTVPVGTGQRLQKLIPDNPYVSSPEFLRESTAIEDTLIYDRIVIGCEDDAAHARIASLYRQIDEHADRINDIAELNLSQDKLGDGRGEIIRTSINSAELIKVAANAFLALKISFANSVAKLADSGSADVTEVMAGVGADKRIGRAFLNAGRGYGGGCFPKDVSGLISVSIDHGVDFNIMTAANELNESMPGYIVNKVREHTSLKGKRIAVLGLAFKPGTSDSRKSPSVKIANTLCRFGAEVVAFDPEANQEAAADLNRQVSLVDSAEAALKNADIVFVATNWPQFSDLKPTDYQQAMKGNTIVDCMNALDKAAFLSAGFSYIGVGR